MRNRRSFASGENSYSQRLHESVESPNPCQEYILQMLKPNVVEKLAKKLGLPPGIIPCLELEVARLQLCLAINRYKTLECDVGCEQDESEAWDTSDSSETSDTDDEVDHSNYDTDDDAPSFENGDSLEGLDSLGIPSNSDDDTSSFKSLDTSGNESRDGKNQENPNFSFTTNCPRVFDSDTDSTSSNDDSSYIPAGKLTKSILKLQTIVFKTYAPHQTSFFLIFFALNHFISSACKTEDSYLLRGRKQFVCEHRSFNSRRYICEIRSST